MAGLVQEHVRTRCGGQLFAAVDGGDLPRRCFVVEDEASATRTTTFGLDKGEHGLHRERCIGSSATQVHDPRTGLTGEVVAAGHGEIARADYLPFHGDDLGVDERVGKVGRRRGLGRPERS